MQRKNFSDLITFTRATTGTWLNPASGLIETAAINAPRIEAKGLLFEQQRTNLASRSEAFTNAIWAKSNVTIVPNAGTAPDGSNTASRVVSGNTYAEHHIRQEISAPADSTLWMGVFVKAAEYSFVAVRSLLFANQATRTEVRVNLVTGEFSVSGAGATEAKVEPLPNGWWRVSIKSIRNNISGGSIGLSLVNMTDMGSFTNQGDGVSGLLMWGAQMEEGDSPSSYIPTAAAAVTRAADLAYVAAGEWLKNGEGTLLIESENRSVLSVATGMLGTAANNPRVMLSLSSTALSRGEILNDTNVSQFGRNLGSAISSGVTLKQAIAYLDGSEAQFSSNALLSPALGPVELPTIDRLTLGTRGVNTGSGHMQGHIRRIQYFPRRLSAAELQALTT